MTKSLEMSHATRALLKDEFQYTAGGYEPVPVFFERANGTKLWVCV
jgi:hypothetical protein